jgi:hypothetical protein
MALDPQNARELSALRYEFAFWRDLLEYESPGMTLRELITRERRHADAVRTKRMGREQSAKKKPG